MGLFKTAEIYPVLGWQNLSSGGGTDIAYGPVLTVPWRLDAIVIKNNDTVARVVDFGIYDGTTTHPLFSWSIPPGVGSDGVTPPLELLAAVFGTAIPDLIFQPNYRMSLAAEVALTSGKTMWFSFIGGLVG